MKINHIAVYDKSENQMEIFSKPVTQKINTLQVKSASQQPVSVKQLPFNAQRTNPKLIVQELKTRMNRSNTLFK